MRKRVIVLTILIALATVAGAQSEGKRSFWGVGAGMVFNKLPVLDSNFKVGLSEIYYGLYLAEPEEVLKPFLELGAYGFLWILPIPKASFGVSVDLLDITLEAAVGGFYDVTLAGHGGFAIELGLVAVDALTIRALIVPFGVQPNKSYGAYLGLKSANSGPEYVEMPYFGILAGLRF